MPSMRAPLCAVLVAAAALVVSPRRGVAQDEGDFAAYAALIFTPPGGLIPLPPPGGAARGSAFVFRYGNLDGDGGSLHNMAVGGDFGTGNGRLGVTLGYTTCDGCEGNIMAGLDYTISLTQTVISAAIRPSFGFSKPTEGSGTFLSFGLSVPLGVDLSGTTGPIFTPYLVPGFGYGRISGEGESESGMRPMLGGGFAITARESALGVHLGFQKVFIDEGEMSFGLGVSIGRRSP